MSRITFKVKVTLVLTTTELTFMILREDIDREIKSVKSVLDKGMGVESRELRDILRRRLSILQDLQLNQAKMNEVVNWSWEW